MLTLLISAAVAAFLGWLILPKEEITNLVSRGRQWAAYAVALATLTTFHKILQPPPQGGAEGVATWLAVCFGFGLFAFISGVAYQASVKAYKKVRSDGPELLGNAIRKTADTTADIVHRLQDAATVRRNCSSCNTLIPADARFCPSCGAAFKEQENSCQGCGEKLAANQTFCSHCGKKVATG